LQGSALLAGGAAAAAALPVDALAAGVPKEHAAAWLALLAPSTPADLATYAPVALTPAELTTLKAALARLIPADAHGPGAVEAGAFVFIDRALKGPNAAQLPLYQGGLAAFDTAAGSGGFAALAAAKQDALLAKAELDELAGVPAGFFAVLLEHTRQGMFSDPIYGGNVGFAGWDLIGYPGVRLVWTAEDQAINAVIKPEHKSIADVGGTPS
jgi:hypothetical protein